MEPHFYRHAQERDEKVSYLLAHSESQSYGGFAFGFLWSSHLFLLLPLRKRYIRIVGI